MSRLALYAPAAGAAWLDACDPRLRVVAAGLIALTVAGLDTRTAAAVALALCALLAALAGSGGGTLVRRLLALEGFMLVLLVMLPFSVPGPAFFALGPLTASEAGLARAILIVLKANAVALAVLALVGSMEPVVLGHALARLRVPAKLVQLFLFTVLYVGVIHDEYRRLRQAMRARAFVARADRHTWRSFGWLIGMLLVRSFERSERIVAAMKCRGFDGRFHLIDQFAWRPGDTALAAVLLVAIAGVLLLERGA
jgi:cobalt/nickel transport system permease protein